jgi:hypothetical protein
VFTPDPIPRPTGPPASSAPVRDYLASPRPGADAVYVVVPRSLAEAMPLPWQQQMAYLLSEFHQAFSHVTWPTYRVVPSRYEKLVDLDEEQLAEVGAMVEIDTDGDVVYRDRAGRVIEHPDQTTVLVACLDPIPPPQPGPPPPGMPPPGAPQPGPLSTFGTQPPHIVVPSADEEPPETPPNGFPAPDPGPAAPGQPFGPTGHQQRRPGDPRW